MLSKSMSPEDISEITGIPLEDVLGLSYENKNTASNELQTTCKNTRTRDSKRPLRVRIRTF